MALAAIESFASASRSPRPRCQLRRAQAKTFAAGSGTLAILTPLAKVRSTGFYVPWAPKIKQVNVITPGGTISGGTFTITVNGVTSAAIAYNASAAQILAAILLLGNVSKDDVTVAGTLATTVTLTWGGKLAGTTVTVAISGASLTGSSPTITLSMTTAGVDDDGTGDIDCFVWPDAVTLNAGGEVIGQVALSADIFLDDIPLVSPALLADLVEALTTGNVRKEGFVIQGCAGF